MEIATFKSISSNIDNRLYSGGLHFLIGRTGSGKSSICEEMEKNNKSNAVFFDIQVEHSDEIYKKLAIDIKTINRHIVIDGLNIYGDAGENVFCSVLEHVRAKKMGALILIQSFDDLSFLHVNVASSISLISDLYPRENSNVYLHSVDIKNNANEKYENLKEFWMKYCICVNQCLNEGKSILYS